MLITALAAAVTAARAEAQQLRGIVRDSLSRAPLSGVVVALTDSAGATLARTITNAAGGYALRPNAGARRIEAKRIGFHSRVIAFGNGETLDFSMAAIPPLLEPVTVRAGAACPFRPDRLQALSLLQQARAGLLATVVARETNKSALVRLRFFREYGEDGNQIVEQNVTIDSTDNATRSFDAVRTGAEVVAEGFVARKPSAQVPIHYGPDAETLLDDDFSAGYCFQLAASDPARPNEVGLAFHPASRKNGRVDIEGTLWIDSVAKSLHDIRFEYVGERRTVGTPSTGGRIEFRTIENGIVVIDRWALRLFTTRVDSATFGVPRATYRVTEAGGELAAATWIDGVHWEAALGELRARAIDYDSTSGHDIVVRLANTGYATTPNDSGLVVIRHLLPGPYAATVTDSISTRLGIAMPTSLVFDAERGVTTQQSFSLPHIEDFVRAECISGVRLVGESRQLPIHVMDAYGRRAVKAVVDVTYHDPTTKRDATQHLIADSDGSTLSCFRFAQKAGFDVHVTYRDFPPFTGHFTYDANAITIRLAPKAR